MNNQELVRLPLKYIQPWIGNQDYKQTKYYLMLFFDFVENHRNGWDLDELSKIVHHQKKVVEELLPTWLKQGWIEKHTDSIQTYYCLSPIEQGKALLIPTHMFVAIKNDLRLIDTIRWLGLQLFPISQISESALTNHFQLDRQTGVYRILKVFEVAQLLWFDRYETTNGVCYELDYFTCEQADEKQLLSITWELDRKRSPQTLVVPHQMKDWIRQSKSLMLPKLYCEWLIYLTNHTNHLFSLNELIKSVFSIQHYKSLQQPLNEMIQKNMICATTEGTKRFKLNETQRLTDGYELNCLLVKRALSELGYREFALWLNLQIEPTKWITTHDVLLRLNCKNKNQARNILKRLSQSGWIKLSNHSHKKREILSLTPQELFNE